MSPGKAHTRSALYAMALLLSTRLLIMRKPRPPTYSRCTAYPVWPPAGYWCSAQARDDDVFFASIATSHVALAWTRCKYSSYGR